MNLQNENLNDLNCSEMNQIFVKMIDDRINEEKIRFLQNWIGNHNVSNHNCNQKIAELEKKKLEIADAINLAKEKQLTFNVLDSIQFNLV